MQPVSDVAVLVALGVLRWLGGGGWQPQRTVRLLHLRLYWCNATAALASGSSGPSGAVAAWWRRMGVYDKFTALIRLWP